MTSWIEAERRLAYETIMRDMETRLVDSWFSAGLEQWDWVMRWWGRRAETQIRPWEGVCLVSGMEQAEEI